MTERSIVVRLRAEVADYVRGLGRAKQATDELGQKSAPRATTALDQMVDSARDNREAWTTAGTAMLGAGAAITAIGVASLRTGIQYNTLQQTSRAALKTLTGSAEEANAQMDRLDEFARTSPFAKQVFITAQRQMLGFGIEARKVVPYLDAIQNAVAAAGGSNHDIAELSRIFSQISASAKITAVDLREFGNRGIDAATIIGSQMGKTGAQIREEITAGTIDAQVALDALAAGMQDRFGGAAENVKTTFEGAADRVRAAWRDLSSDIASGLVDPEGGGLLVDWLNSLADAMRGFENLPGPVKAVTAGLVGLTGVGLTLGGAALVVVPRLVELYDSLGKLGPMGQRAQRGMRGVAGALPTAGRVAGVAVAVTALAGAVGMLVEEFTSGDVRLGANELERAIRGVAERGGDIEDLGGEFSKWGTFLGMSRNEAKSLTDAFDQMLRPSVTDRMSSFFDGIPGVTGYMENLEERVKGVDAALASMAAAGDAESVREFQAALEDAGYTTEEINKLLPETKDALIGVEESTPGVAAGLGEVSAAQEAATEALAEWREMVGESLGSFVDIKGAYDTVVQANRDAAQATADATESSKDSWEDYYDGLSVTAAQIIEEYRKQVEAQQNWATNIKTLSQRVNTEVPPYMRDTANAMIDELLRLGPEGAAAVEALKGASEDELIDMVRLYEQKGASAAAGLVREVESHRAPKVTVEVQTARAMRQLSALNSTLNSINGRTVTAYAAVVRYGQGALASGGYVGDFATALGYADGGTPRHFPSGGSVHGPGTSTSDSIPAWLSTGEYVIKAKAVERYGRATFDALNQMRYAAGGPVRSAPMPVWTGGGAGSHAAAAPSLTGLAIEGVLETPFGPAQIRGVVRDELADVGARARYAEGGR